MSNNLNRDSFVLYRSFVDIIRDLDDSQAKEFFLAISDYALDGKVPTLQGFLNTLWKPVKPQLDANIRRYENGKKGGAPKGSRNNPFGRRGKSSCITTDANQNSNHSHLQQPEDRSIHTIHSNPTLEAVKNYVHDKKSNVDPEEFFLYYQGQGWKINGQPIVDWTAVLERWHRKAIRKQKEEQATQNLGPGERYNSNGTRTYDSGIVEVPRNAPIRPSLAHWWNRNTMSWDNAV